jgi:hypothetical protein
MNCITLPLSLLLIFSLTIPSQAQQSRERSRNVGIVTLVSHPAVSKELKLKDEQTAALKQAAEEARKGIQAARQLKDDAARRTKNNEANQKLRGVIAKTLNAEQRTRLLQIELQWSAGAWILRRMEVSKMLELTKDQRQELLELAQKSRKTTQELRATQNDDNRQEVQRKIAAALFYTRESALKLLTEEQQKKWKKAIGEPFELPSRRQKKQR